VLLSRRKAFLADRFADQFGDALRVLLGQEVVARPKSFTSRLGMSALNRSNFAWEGG
jgi:hypothetical protein